MQNLKNLNNMECWIHHIYLRAFVFAYEQDIGKLNINSKDHSVWCDAVVDGDIPIQAFIDKLQNE